MPCENAVCATAHLLPSVCAHRRAASAYKKITRASQLDSMLLAVGERPCQRNTITISMPVGYESEPTSAEGLRAQSGIKRNAVLTRDWRRRTKFWRRKKNCCPSRAVNRNKWPGHSSAPRHPSALTWRAVYGCVMAHLPQHRFHARFDAMVIKGGISEPDDGYKSGHGKIDGQLRSAKLSKGAVAGAALRQDYARSDTPPCIAEESAAA